MPSEWTFTAIDFETGVRVFSQLAGTGGLYNNAWSPVYLGRNGSMYVGLLAGLVAMRDG